jgi:hypothetical protein
VSDEDEPTDPLYDLDPAEFTAARNALAAELRAGGDGEGAARVKALRRPSRAAWAANRLIRAEPELVDALLGAGGELRQAHRQATSGRRAEQLRDAAAAEREAVGGLVDRLPDALGQPPSPALAEAVRNTLHAAAGDDQARELIRSGRLTEELRPAGLGPALAAPGPDDAREAATEEAEHRSLTRAAEAELAALRREADAAEGSLKRSDANLARAREKADEAAERAKDARKRLHDARAALKRAEAARRSLDR